jgi:hypothetical protein
MKSLGPLIPLDQTISNPVGNNYARFRLELLPATRHWDLINAGFPVQNKRL